jgi:hypothetical protein
LGTQAASGWNSKLAFLDGLSGALIGAGAAGNADVSVDDVLAVALGDSLNGALLSTGTARNTSVSNDVSHDVTSNFLVFWVRYV